MKEKCGWLALALYAAAPSYAGDVYRWIDGQGRVHVSDRAPREHKNSAVRADSKRHELTDAERKHARPDIDDSPKPSRLTDAQCAEWYQAYRESEACYEPFRWPNRSLKPGAFEACGPAVLDPSWDCGKPKIPH